MNFVMRDVEPEPEKDGGEPLDAEILGNGHGAEGHATDEAGEETEFIATGEKKPLNQSAMMLFAIIAIGGAGLWVMNKRSGPQAARAADPTTVAAQATISDFMKRGSANVSMLRALLDGTAKIVEQIKLPHVVQVPLSDLKSNPFRFASAAKPAATADDGSEAARRRKEQEKLAVQTAVRSLQLQSLVLRNNRKACMINNVLYQEGEVVDDFTIESISSEGVVVKHGIYRFRLQMAR